MTDQWRYSGIFIEPEQSADPLLFLRVLQRTVSTNSMMILETDPVNT